ncbi:IS3 family transposase [Priestia megaterium]
MATQTIQRKEVFKYIELYYNTKRMHYLSPIEYEKAYSS